MGKAVPTHGVAAAAAMARRRWRSAGTAVSKTWTRHGCPSIWRQRSLGGTPECSMWGAWWRQTEMHSA